MKWYVAATKPAHERLAQQNLERQNFGTFLPLRKKSFRWRRKITTRHAPLFPGYLFIEMNPYLVRWRAINSTIGVKRLIANDERPVPLPDGFVETLLANLDDEGTLKYSLTLKPGARVEMAAGPFARQIGELIELDDRGRVAVLLSVLSAQIPVRTTVSNLLPA